MTAVYILISSGQDLYYEQLLVSLYSLRMHNPELNVVVLVDDVTERTLHGKRSKVRELANEIKSYCRAWRDTVPKPDRGTSRLLSAATLLATSFLSTQIP